METKKGIKTFAICVLGNQSDRADDRVAGVDERGKLATELRCAFEECSAEGVNVEKGVWDL
jgi:hypothetical protein